jgi:hypothetical protein
MRSESRLLWSMKKRSMVARLARWSFSRLGHRSRNSVAIYRGNGTIDHSPEAIDVWVQVDGLSLCRTRGRNGKQRLLETVRLSFPNGSCQLM